MKTFSANPATVKRDWYVVDAAGKTLGRLASEVARRLRGKHKPEYTPHVDTGDYISVVNAEKVRVTGRKTTDKMYHRFTGYIGNFKTIPFGKLQVKAPARIIELAVKGMLPKNADTIIKVLKVASDCPRLAGSMDKIANDIKAYQEKKERAIKRLKKNVKAHETYYPHRPCPPAMDWAGGPAGGC